MDDESLFKRAMGDVRPLEGPRRRVARRVRRTRVEPSGSGPPARLAVTRFAGHVEGVAEGAGEEPLGELRAGAIPVERKVDLHGLTAEQARLLVRDILATAWKTRQRCVLIVHGRGLRSGGGAVLKEELPQWLVEAPHARRVLAFTTAGPHGGRGGATAVLLRRR